MRTPAKTVALRQADKPASPPLSCLGRCGKVLRFAAHRAEEQKLQQVASSLTFTTVLAIVPMLAVVLSLFTAFPVFQEFRLALEDFLAHSLMPPNVSSTIMEHLNQFAQQASRLTAIGAAFLLVTSILMIMTIDSAFNDIWSVTRQRPLRQRALVYWAVITLGPVVVGGSLWATSFVARESLGLVKDVSPALAALISFTPLLLTGLGFAALFVVVPNRRVYWRDALAGGFGTAIILEAMKSGFAFYVTQFPTYTVIYGAFATLPLFLLWIYLSWLAVLLGATTAASLPLIRSGRWEMYPCPGAPFIDALAVLRLLWTALGTVAPDRSSNRLSRDLQLHHDELNAVLAKLAELNLIAPTQDNRWILACDPARTSLAPLVDAFLLQRNQVRLRDDSASAALLRAFFSDSTAPTLEEVASAMQNSGIKAGKQAGPPATKRDTEPALKENSLC